jgi:hypothetical protein
VADSAERFDPEGTKIPKGEWKLAMQSFELCGEAATGQKQRNGLSRGEPEQVVEQKGRTGGAAVQQGSEVAGRKL